MEPFQVFLGAGPSAWRALRRAGLAASFALVFLGSPSAGVAAGGLSDDWNLNTPAGGEAAFQVYRPNYFLPARHTDHLNTAPSSPASGRTVASPEDLDATEAKFQLSVKSQLKGWNSVFGREWWGFDRTRLWFAYTQQSNWQLWNTRNSSPFRESNYEPELIVTLGRAAADSPFRLVNLGLAHQSNGQSDPKSRSWWRVYLQGGFEVGDWSALARVWRRTDRGGNVDDNPDISDYVGRGDLVLQYRGHDQSVVLLLRDNLRGDPNRGFAQLDWSLPWFWPLDGLNGGSSRFHLQATTGYGESLIDYNFRQTTLGVGFAFGFDRKH
jgi:phospholipase A1